LPITKVATLQLNVQFSHHKIDLESGLVEAEKRLCFVLEEPKQENEDRPSKKRKKKTKKSKEKKAPAFSMSLNKSKPLLVHPMSGYGFDSDFWRQDQPQEDE